MRGHPSTRLKELFVIESLPALRIAFLSVVIGVLRRLAHPGDHSA